MKMLKFVLLLSLIVTGSLVLFYEKNKQLVLGSEETVFFGSNKKLEFLAKVDSGAETTSLHAINIETYRSNIITNGISQSVLFVKFETTDDNGEKNVIEKPVCRKSIVKSASGSRERIFIQEKIWIGSKSFTVEVNLADRSNLSKKVLIGKNVIRLGYLINARESFLVSYL